MNRKHFVARPAAALAIVLMLSPAFANAQTKIKPGWNLFSPQDDVQIGEQSAVAAEQQLPILNDPTVENYVNRIGQKLAANAGGPQFQYRFRVVNATDINAFALPGGFIYVNRGVLDNARNEGEVAGVLAHEISHVALRHGTHQASKAYAAQAGLSILGGLLGGHVGEGTANVINAVGGFGLNALFLKYSRDIESQADVRGAQILAASGYSPGDMIGFFQTLERVDPSKKTSFLADHPAPPDRIARLQREAQLLHVSPSPTTNVAELRQIQSRLGGYSGGINSRQVARTGPTAPAARSRASGTGTVVNVDGPSASMRSYTSQSGLYQISYPANWRVYESGSTGVTIAPEGGLANANGSTDVVYGAVINHYDPFGNTSSRQGLRPMASSVYEGNITLDQATDDLVAQIRQGSPYLRPVSGAAERFRMGGGTALAATLRGVDPATGIDERVTVVTRQLADEHLVYLLFVTPERDASRYSSVLDQMVSSMRVNDTTAH